MCICDLTDPASRDHLYVKGIIKRDGGQLEGVATSEKKKEGGKRRRSARSLILTGFSLSLSPSLRSHTLTLSRTKGLEQTAFQTDRLHRGYNDTSHFYEQPDGIFTSIGVTSPDGFSGAGFCPMGWWVGQNFSVCTLSLLTARERG